MAQVMQQNTGTVYLEARQPVEIQPKLLLAAGRYLAVKKRIGAQTLDGMNWTAPEYVIELTVGQLATMGMELAANLISAKFDVSKFVLSRDLVIA